MKKQPQVKKAKQPWPTKDAMSQVYEMNLWGNNNSDFYSGDGSHLPELVDPYLKVVQSFLKSFEKPLTVCDFGCGDFNVGKELVNYSKEYIAVDIVPSLIARNKEKFNNKKLTFYCLDIATAELPKGDCVLLRQVLQHLSNQEINHILTKLTAYKYIVLTEHVPEGDFIANKDIISGQGIRLKKQSGLKVTAAPFNFKIKEEQEMLVVKLNNNKGKIVTTLYTVF